jgi:hypothetical protein
VVCLKIRIYCEDVVVLYAFIVVFTCACGFGHSVVGFLVVVLFVLC